MGHPGFSDLVGGLVEAMGLNVAAARPRDEMVLVQTPDGFVFAFVDDTSRVSLEQVDALFAERADTPSKVVVLTPDRLPLALGAEVGRKGGTLVEGNRFTELARGLGLGERLGEPPRATVEKVRPRLLPSARALDSVLERAKTWESWGVPALALRFYRQASEMKPEFLPARLGIGRALLSLGLPIEADRTFEEVERAQPGNLDARIGRAAVLGATGHPEKEIAEYRRLVSLAEGRADLRAHLLAALLDGHAWSEAREELDTMLRTMPDDPRLRFLHAVTLERLGRGAEATRERDRARTLGLSYDAEKALCEHLGLPVPAASSTASPGAGSAEARATRSVAKRRPPAKSRRAPARAPRPTPRRTKPRRSR
jgi:tetratricopeptide (TPR) repeat protein